MLTVVDKSGNGMGVGFVYRASVTGQLIANGYGATVLVTGEFNISLYGTFSATINIVRSFDNGVTWRPLTAGGLSMAFTGPAEEVFQEDEPGVLYTVLVSGYVSGTVKYRIAQ